MKKVCFFAHSNTLNGANRSMLDFIEQMSSSNSDYNFFVIIPKKGPIEKELVDRNIKYFYVKSFAFTKKIDRKLDYKFKLKIIMKKVINLIAEKRIEKIVKRESTEIIHVNNTMTFIGAKVARNLSLPYVWHLREFLDKDHGLEFTNNEEMRMMLNGASSCIAISDVIENYYINKYNLKNITRIYNGIPINRYEFIRPDFSRELYITVFGRITPGKDQLTVLKALQIIKKQGYDFISRMLIIGSDDSGIGYKEELENFINLNHLNDIVTTISHVDNVMDYRKISDITIVSSLSEAFGRVTIEGMMASQLVVVSDSGANKELVTNNINEVIFKTSNPNELAKKLIEINNNKKKYFEVLKKGHDLSIENFSIEITANNIIKVYDLVG